MFAIVRLIDSQEHQYPKQEPDPKILRKTNNPEKPTGLQNRDNPRSKERPVKTNVLKTVRS
jgi:hypothetical protein